MEFLWMNQIKEFLIETKSGFGKNEWNDLQIG